MEVDIQTLQEKYPAQFQKEYEDWNQHALDYPWWDDVYEDWIEKLEKIGINTGKRHIQFSGFWSQGDGASFTGSIDVPKFAEAHDLHEYLPVVEAFRLDLIDGCQLTRIDSRYSHENTVDMEVKGYSDYNFSPTFFIGDGVFAGLSEESLYLIVDPIIDDFVETAEEICRNYMRELYNDLNEEHDYLTSEEQFIESCVCNEVTFDVEVEDESED